MAGGFVPQLGKSLPGMIVQKESVSYGVTCAVVNELNNGCFVAMHIGDYDRVYDDPHEPIRQAVSKLKKQGWVNQEAPYYWVCPSCAQLKAERAPNG
jgi:hypothetical protein